MPIWFVSVLVDGQEEALRLDTGGLGFTKMAGLLLGQGQVLRGDDGFGPAVAGASRNSNHDADVIVIGSGMGGLTTAAPHDGCGTVSQYTLEFPVLGRHGGVDSTCGSIGPDYLRWMFRWLQRCGRSRGMVLAVLAAAMVGLVPSSATADAGGLALRLDPTMASDPARPAPPPGALRGALEAAPPDAGALDFDLLGEAPAPTAGPDAGALRTRRTILTLHQGLGIGLVGLSVATVAVGQLDYNDKFNGGPNTGKYRAPHAVLAYTTAGVFAVTGLTALLAPSPVEAPATLDWVMVHRIALFTATAAMAAQVGLGIYTASREGYVDQAGVAKVHLVLGYVTLAAIAAGVGALVF